MYYIVIWQLLTLWNEHHDKSSNCLSPHKVVTVLLTVFLTLCMTSLWLFCYITGGLYLFISFAYFTSAPLPYFKVGRAAAAAAAKLLQSCPTLCDPIDSSPPGYPIPGILQARTLEWVAISFSNRQDYICWNNKQPPICSGLTHRNLLLIHAESSVGQAGLQGLTHRDLQRPSHLDFTAVLLGTHDSQNCWDREGESMENLYLLLHSSHLK